MFISKEEKQLILDVLELLEKRLEMVTERIEKLEGKGSATITVSTVDAPHGIKKDGTPAKKRGRPSGVKK